MLRIFFALLVISISCCWSSSSSSSSSSIVVEAAKEETTKTTKIAIIGGGISGSFVTKYLTDYDNTSCSLDITIYDPYHTGIIDDSIENENENENENESIQNQQGSRVSSYTLKDGTVVERGASIIFSGNKLVNDMIDSSGTTSTSSSNNIDSNKLKRIKPHGSDAGSGGMAIYNGSSGDGSGTSSSNGERFPIMFTNNMTSNEKTSILLWRYNIDLYKINSATDKTIELFNRIYTELLLNDNENDDNDNDDNNDDNNDNADDDVYKYLNSPNYIWKYIGLYDIANISFNEYLIKTLGVSNKSILWYIRKYLFESLFSLTGIGTNQGLVSNELYEPMNICNNNQINKQITGK
jgi:prenylcysteine oxidase/farnesylcysteine lyase